MQSRVVIRRTEPNPQLFSSLGSSYTGACGSGPRNESDSLSPTMSRPASTAILRHSSNGMSPIMRCVGRNGRDLLPGGVNKNSRGKTKSAETERESLGALRSLPNPTPRRATRMSLGLAPTAAVAAPRASQHTRGSATACVSTHRRGDAKAISRRIKTWTRGAQVSWTTTPHTSTTRRGSSLTVHAGERYRDEIERQRAIDRLSPKPAGRSTDDDGSLPTISRPKDVTRPKRFKDAVAERVDASVKSKSDRDYDASQNDPDPLEQKRLRNAKRLERADAESADRLAYLVAVIREELGRPSVLLSLDGKTRDLRFTSCFHRLRNFGALEIAFGLAKYYDKHWDEVAEEGVSSDDPLTFLKSEGNNKNSLDEMISDESRSEELRERAAWAKDVLGDSVESSQDTASVSQDDGEAKDEKTRRQLLRAAQLKATGVADDDPRASQDYDPDDSEKDANISDVLDALADVARSYFSVDFVENEEGGKEMVVMTSPEFLAFFLIAVIVSGRIGHWVVMTYFATPIDPLLR